MGRVMPGVFCFILSYGILFQVQFRMCLLSGWFISSWLSRWRERVTTGFRTRPSLHSHPLPFSLVTGDVLQFPESLHFLSLIGLCRHFSLCRCKAGNFSSETKLYFLEHLLFSTSYVMVFHTLWQRVSVF